MIDTKLRKNAQPAFNYCAHMFIKLKLSANMITVMALVIGVLAGIFVGVENYALGATLLWISGFLDVVDGSVARLTMTSSKMGAYMDMIFDRLVEASIIIGFFFAIPENALAYLFFFVAVLFNFTTFTVAGALFANSGEKAIHYDVGIAERTETFIVFTLMMIYSQNSGIILMVFNGIVAVTGIFRFYKIAKHLKKEL